MKESKEKAGYIKVLLQLGTDNWAYGQTRPLIKRFAEFNGLTSLKQYCYPITAVYTMDANIEPDITRVQTVRKVTPTIKKLIMASRVTKMNTTKGEVFGDKLFLNENS